MNKVLWLDLETTGLDPKTDSIIELGAIYYENGALKDQCHFYIKYPDYKKDFSVIEELTSITKEFLEENGLNEIEAYQTFIDFLNDKVSKYDKLDKMILAGFVTKFDDGFLRAWFKSHNNEYYGSYIKSATIDVLNTAAIANVLGILPDTIPNFKLETIAKHFGIEYQSHGALRDIKVTRRVNHLMMIEISNKYLKE